LSFLSTENLEAFNLLEGSPCDPLKIAIDPCSGLGDATDLRKNEKPPSSISGHRGRWREGVAELYSSSVAHFVGERAKELCNA
jgi:hypothetical protein